MGQVFCNRSLLVISMMIFGLWYSHLFSLPACRWGHFTSSRVWWEVARLQVSWYYFVCTKLASQMQHCSNHPFIDEPIVITELTLPTAGLFCLSSRLYPTIMQRALNKDVTWFMQSLSQVHKNWESERKLCWQSVLPDKAQISWSSILFITKRSKRSFRDAIETKVIETQ